MSLARTLSVALAGVSGSLVEVEADLSQGLPGLTFTGLPDTSVTEARDRVRAAVLNSGLSWPNQRITVALLPADLRKNGSMFDLALALAVLAAAGAIPPAVVVDTVWLGELGLDGRLRTVRGVLPAVLAARERGVRKVVVPAGNAGEAALVTELEVFEASSLIEVVRWLRDEGPPLSRARILECAEAQYGADLADVVGQPMGRRALEIAAAGAHHLLFQGAPGAGKTMLAARLPSILPPLDDRAALEVTAIHSVAGALQPGVGLVRRPPLQAPHHTATMASLVGGGSGLGRPGAASLAHRGVLVLDEAAETKYSPPDELVQVGPSRTMPQRMGPSGCPRGDLNPLDHPSKPSKHGGYSVSPSLPPNSRGTEAHPGAARGQRVGHVLPGSDPGEGDRLVAPHLTTRIRRSNGLIKQCLQRRARRHRPNANPAPTEAARRIRRTGQAHGAC